MKKQLQTIAGSFIAVVMLLTAFAVNPVIAQDDAEPVGYLVPMDEVPPPVNASTIYRWDYQRDYYLYNGQVRNYTYYKYQWNPVITDMTIYNDDGTPLYYEGRDLSINREGSYAYVGGADNYTGDGILFPGSDYIVSQTVKYRYMQNTWREYCTSFWYYYYEDYYPGVHRVFIDFNRDAKFDGENVFNSGIDEWINGNAETEYVQFFNKTNMAWDPYPWGNFYYYLNFCNSDPFVYEYEMTVPSDVEGGKSRVRFMAQSRWFKRDNYIYAWQPNPNFSATRWYWFDPANANLSGYVYYFGYSWGQYMYFYNYGSTFDYTVEFGLPIEGLFPSNQKPDNILLAGYNYDGTYQLNENDELEYFKRPYVEMKDVQPSGTYMRYSIVGPLPKKDELYIALDENGSQWHDLSNPNIMHEFNNSVMSNASPTGSGELNLQSGVYEVVLELLKPGQTPGVDEPKRLKYEFNVVWVNDLAVENITRPDKDGPPNFTTYIRGINIPVQAIFKNMGLRPVYQFLAKAFIFYSDGTLAQEFEYEFDARDDDTQPLESLESYTVDFPNFNTQQVDRFEIVVTGNLLSAEDQEPYNDRFERADAEYPRTFVVKDEIEAAIMNPIIPTENGIINVSRPFIPSVLLVNNGISDVSDATATFVIKNSSDEVVKQGTTTVQEIPAGLYNTKYATFEPMDIGVPGTYTARFEIDANGDIMNKDASGNVVENSTDLYRNVYEYTFTVDGGLEGEYSVGQGGDFMTLTDAVDALYSAGMNGSVTLSLIGGLYQEGHNKPEKLDRDDPAIDLTTEIIGLGWDEANKRYNTLTIKPSEEKSFTRGSITIELYSLSGKGFEFGQDINSSNRSAAIRDRINDHYFTRFANSPGHIIFDGGSNKSIRVKLFSEGNSPFGSAFFLQRGSQNIQVKNMIIENATPSISNSTWLPGATHSLNNGFQFESDIVITQSGDASYSAGITNRGTLIDRMFAYYDGEGNLLSEEELQDLPDDQVVEEVPLNLDTVDNVNNVFKGNEIRGFGYGIVTLGTGALYHQNARPRPSYIRHYNRNTVIEGNIIRDVARAGIYAGFEEGLKIQNNVIQGVSGQSNDNTGYTSGEAYGIILGDEQARNEQNSYLAPNNINVVVSGNTISGLSAVNEVKGIHVVQQENRYVDPDGGFQAVPGETDNINIHSNAIWDLEASGNNAHRAGIHVYTERNRNINNFLDQMVSPMLADYSITGLMVANNTVMIGDDGVDNAGMTVGIGIQNAYESISKNNAIAITDNNMSGAVNSLLFYQGMQPTEGLVTSDYNAFYRINDNIDITRFVESKAFDIPGEGMQTIITHVGMSGEYSDLLQWQMWTDQDINSISGTDFTQDYITSGMSPKRLSAVNPAPHSVLNNRGEIIEEVVYDVNGKKRGVADERYDIGAVEFDGKMYRRDVETMLITEPGVYRATEGGLFDDAEYIMVKDVIEVTARIRNNSSADLTDIPVYLEIRNTATGSTTTLETEYVDVDATDTESVTFLVDDRTDSGDETDIRTFAELSMSPDRVLFRGMEHNVTPIYEFTLKVDYDENNLNNNEIRSMRFYIQRSPMQLAVSNTSYEPSSVTQEDELAVHLNSKAVYDAFASMGWRYDVAWNDDEITEDRIDYDVFNRSGWYDRTVDYSIFRSIIWTDGNDIPLTRWEELSLHAFLMSANTDMKRNMVIGSQEIISPMMGGDQTPEFDLARDGFRAESRFPYTPLRYEYPNIDGNYSGYDVTGVNVANDLSFGIISTEVANDRDPYPALLTPISEGEGNARTAFVYNTVRNVDSDQLVDMEEENSGYPESRRVMGVAATSLYRNVVTYGVDWRHFGDPQSMLRAAFDFIESNGGLVVPVELTDFTAEQVNNRVDLAWSTSSESNSAQFEVEKALKTSAGRSVFNKIDEVSAAGNSAVTQYYSSTDRDITSGETYIYRLKMLDLDGEFEYSSEVEVAIDASNGITLHTVMPNPVQSTSTMQYTLTSGNDVSIKLYDVTGKAVAELVNGYRSAGTHELTIDAQDLPSGSYSIVLTSNGTVLTRNVNIVK